MKTICLQTRCCDPDISVTDPKYRQKIFRQAAASGTIAFLSTSCRDVSQKTIDRAIQLAARNGHLDCLKILTRHTHTPPDFALVQAARRGHTWCVKYLIKSANAEYCDGWAIRLAAKYGFDRCVEALFEPSRKCVQARKDEAYRNALRSTNLKSIKRLGNLGDNRIININDEMPEYWKNKLFAAVRQKKCKKPLRLSPCVTPRWSTILIFVCVSVQCSITNSAQNFLFKVERITRETITTAYGNQQLKITNRCFTTFGRWAGWKHSIRIPVSCMRALKTNGGLKRKCCWKQSSAQIYKINI